MMQSAPTQYGSEAQFLSPGAQGYHPAQSPQLIPSQHFAPAYQQQQQGILWKLLCCFKGNKSSYLRHASVVFGGIVVTHGLIALILATVAMTENPRAEVPDPDFPNNTYIVDKAPTLGFYQLYVSLPRAEAIREKKIIGGIFGALLTTIIDEVLPGACLIAGALLLKDILCLVSVVGFAISFLLNGTDIPLFILGLVVFSFAPVDCTKCDLNSFISGIFIAIVIRLIFCCYILFCIIVAFGLRQQIKNGVYDMGRQPPPMTYSATGGQAAIGEQADWAAEATRPTEEAVVEST